MAAEEPNTFAWVVHANATIKGEAKLVTVRCKHASALGAAEQATRELYRLGAASGDVQSMHIERV